MRMQSPIQQSARRAPRRAAKPPRRQQAERSATTRRDLLDAAVGCLGEVGYQQLTMELVSTKAKVSRGAVQHHFGSRDDLILAVVEDIGAALVIEEAVLTTTSLPQQLDGTIDHDWKVLSSPQFAAVMQIWLAERGNADLFPKIQKTVTAVEKRLDRRWTQAFAGSGLNPTDIVSLRHVVLSALRGLCLRSIFHGNTASNASELAMLKLMASEIIRKKT